MRRPRFRSDVPSSSFPHGLRTPSLYERVNVHAPILRYRLFPITPTLISSYRRTYLLRRPPRLGLSVVMDVHLRRWFGYPYGVLKLFFHRKSYIHLCLS
jgi:hypothetical protein